MDMSCTARKRLSNVNSTSYTRSSVTPKGQHGIHMDVCGQAIYLLTLIVWRIVRRVFMIANFIAESCKSLLTSVERLKAEYSVDLVERKRKDQGSHECEVMRSSDTAECAYTWAGCTKNPGHPNFIPVSQFDKKHLPKGYRGTLVMDCIQNVIKCTGRLRVCYTSWARPDNFAFAVARGLKIQHTGTAYVYRVSAGKGQCPCPDVGGHNGFTTKWWRVALQTACHVVFNTEEAKAAKVDLFFDDKKACMDGRVKTLHGLEVRDQNVAGDRCELLCATHDSNLVKELKTLIKQSVDLFNSLSSEKKRDSVRSDLCVMVSHPHGMHKHVTVGKMKSRIKMNGIGRRKFTYDTDTCPGSSGAPIIMPLGVTFWQVRSPWMAPHSSVENDRFNKSGEGDVWWV